MEKIISLIDELKEIIISDDEKRILLKIINEQISTPKIKISKIKKLLSFRRNNNNDKAIEEEKIEENERKKLIDIGILEKDEKNDLLNIEQNDGKKGKSSKYRISSKGLLYIFNQNYIYPPSFLILYEKDEILQKILYQFFNPNTLRSSTAKFFNIIREYLHSVSSYLFNLSNVITIATISKNKTDRVIEQELSNFSVLLGYKIITMFNEHNLLNQTIEQESEKAIVVLYEIESQMKTRLANDKNFQKLLFKIREDFLSNCNEMINLIKK